MKTISSAIFYMSLCMGHMASDSIGFNQILDAWEARGVEVTRIGGLV